MSTEKPNQTNQLSIIAGPLLFEFDSFIEWTEQTWNPVTGCTKVSAGCTNTEKLGGDDRVYDQKTGTAQRRKAGISRGQIPDALRARLPLPGPEPQGTKRGEQWRELTSGSWWATEPDVGRVAHGIPGRVDRLKALGNAVVPQIPEIIDRAIMALENAQ